MQLQLRAYSGGCADIPGLLQNQYLEEAPPDSGPWSTQGTTKPLSLQQQHSTLLLLQEALVPPHLVGQEYEKELQVQSVALSHTGRLVRWVLPSQSSSSHLCPLRQPECSWRHI